MQHNSGKELQNQAQESENHALSYAGVLQKY